MVVDGLGGYDSQFVHDGQSSDRTTDRIDARQKDYRLLPR